MHLQTRRASSENGPNRMTWPGRFKEYTEVTGEAEAVTLGEWEL